MVRPAMLTQAAIALYVTQDIPRCLISTTLDKSVPFSASACTTMNSLEEYRKGVKWNDDSDLDEC